MEDLFECILPDEEAEKMIREVYKKQIFSPANLVCYSLIFIVFCIGLYKIAEGLYYNFIEFVDYAYWMLLVLFPICVIIEFIRYQKRISIWKKRRNELGVKADEIVTVSEEYIKIFLCENNMERVEKVKTALNDIKKINVSKNLILLRSSAKLVYIFPKEHFTKGTPEEFIEFIKSKIKK